MLTFEQQLTVSTDSSIKQEFICNEPNNDLYKYYVESNSRTSDAHTHITLGSYTDIAWSLPERHLTSQEIKRIGIKHFPQVGAIGFFTLLHEERSKILAPIHIKTKKYAAPRISIQDLGTTLLITIVAPDNSNTEPDKKINYICYRVILRLGDFAHEYVTYESTIEIPKPITTGAYDIYCVGYIHEGEAVSEDSNHISLNIVGTQEDWPGPMEGSDIFVTDIEVTEDNKINFKRSDGYDKTSDNAIKDTNVYPIAATFTDVGRLELTLSDGSKVLTDNAVSGGGGGSANVYLSTPAKVLPGISAFTMHSDTELANSMSASDFIVSDNVKAVQKIDSLNAKVTMLNTLVAGDSIEIQATDTAYKNANGFSETLLINVEELTFAGLCGDLTLMTNVRNNSKGDSTTDTLYSARAWTSMIGGGSTTRFDVTGDSEIKVGPNSGSICINKRDASVYYIWKQDGFAEGTHFFKIRWKGASQYNSYIDLEWEAYFLENGDLFIYLISAAANAGTFSLFGKPFTLNKANPYVSVYRIDPSGNVFIIVNEPYNITKNGKQHKNGALSTFIGNYSSPTVIAVNGVKYDDNAVDIYIPSYIPGVSYVRVGGDSWIGLNSASYDVTFVKRDAALLYLYLNCIVLSDYNNLKAAQIIWGGSSRYNIGTDRWWELWLFENGDAMIYSKQIGSYTDGASSFRGISYSPSNGSYHSFYKNGSSYTLVNAVYDLSKHIN